MAIYFLDSSALVKRYVLEPGSTWLRELLDAIDPQTDQPLHTVFIADITVTEATAAFAVLYRVGRVRRSAWDAVFNRSMDDLTWSYRLVGARRDDFFDGANLTRRHPLKAYDAVQLAVALVERSLTFVSGDKTLLSAAQAEGLLTDNPFDHVSPLDTPQASNTM
jgi:hypothetical protein